jgi:hypothetical protein
MILDLIWQCSILFFILFTLEYICCRKEWGYTMYVPINSVYIDGQSNSESWTLEWQILKISKTERTTSLLHSHFSLFNIVKWSFIHFHVQERIKQTKNHVIMEYYFMQDGFQLKLIYMADICSVSSIVREMCMCL